MKNNIHKVVLLDHSRECWGGEWCCPEYINIHERDRTGRINRKAWSEDFLKFRCNDPSCPSELIIPVRDVTIALGLNRGKKKGTC